MTAAYQLPLPLPATSPAAASDRAARALCRRRPVASGREARTGCSCIRSPTASTAPRKPPALLQRLGVLPGAFDLLLIGPDGVHRWMEIKRAAGGRLSPAQQWFADELQRRGVPYAVAGGFDQAVEVLQSWGVLRPCRVQ